MKEGVLALAQRQILKKLPFVIYKKPSNQQIHFIGQFTDNLYEFDYNQHLEGFVMAPFDDQKISYFIKNDNYVEEFFEGIDAVGDFIVDDFIEGKIQHEALVTKAVQTIKNSEIVKIVLSRVEEKKLEDIDLLKVFTQMASRYTNAFVYVWYHPKIGFWSGATPELLLKSNHQYFYTMALAGTQVDKGALKPVWGEKELEEQQMVTKFIERELKPICKDLQVGKTKTMKAGKLLHLRTDISGELSNRFQIKHLISSLHPTPAVCGLPKLKSKEFILANEGYDREFYTGYLGVISSTNTELYVNLRCLSYKENKLKIYVGGGITEKSIPEKEWQETVEKSKTIKGFIL